jgi:hypothetical protein
MFCRTTLLKKIMSESNGCDQTHKKGACFYGTPFI